MVRHSLDSVSEFARRGYNLRITCTNRSCAHVVEAKAMEMMRELYERRASQMIDALEPRMKCGKCGHRGAKISACEPSF